jgi:DNA-binding MarR family transcriptional regulator
MQSNLIREPSPCYCLRSRKASANVSKFYDIILEPCGVTARQFSLLLNISKAEQCSVKELADMTDLDRSTLTRSLRPLYSQGLIIDTKPPGTRNSHLELTAEGRKTLKASFQLWSKAQQSLQQKLGEEGLATLEKAFALLDNL